MGKKKKRSGPDGGFEDTTVDEISQVAQGRFSSGAFPSRPNIAQPPSQIQLENRGWTSSSYGGQFGPSFQSREPANYYAQGVPVHGSPWAYATNRVPSQASRSLPESRVTGMYDARQEAVGFGYAPSSAYGDSYEDLRDTYSNQPFSSPHSRAAQAFNSRENSGRGRVLDDKIRGFESSGSLAAGKEQSQKLHFDDNRQQGLRSEVIPSTGRIESKSSQSSQRNSNLDSFVDRFESTNQNNVVRCSSMGTEKMIARAEKAATVAYEEVLLPGKGVTLWKVVQAMLPILKADSLESLGIQLHDVPSLQKLLLLEGKVNTYIQCHVAVRRLTTLHDLSVEISQQEGVKDFNQLGLGPISSHPLVTQYFAPTQSEVCKITTEDVLQHLSDYMNKNPGKIQMKDFLAFMTKERSLPSPEHLCVRIQSFGMYASFIRREKKAEKAVASHRANLVTAKELSATHQNQEPSITKRIDLFLAATRNEDAADHAQHTYLSSDDDEPSVAKEMKSSDVGGMEKDISVSSQLQSNSCPYPSAAEERVRFRTKFPAQESEYAISKQELGDFISAWKGVCHNHSVCEVFMRILDAYPNKTVKKSVKMRTKLAKMFRVYPAIGILNVAVMSMKAGHWDSLYDAFEDAAIDKIHQNREANTAEAHEGIDITATAAGQPSPTAKAPDGIEITAAATGQLSPKVIDLTEDPLTDEGAPGEEKVLEEFVRILGEICMEEDGGLGIIGHEAFDEQWFCAVVKSITKCEKILVQQFSLNEFSGLKLGKFSEFIEDHWDKISEEILGIYKKRIRRRHWKNVFPEQRVWSFILQVTVAIGDIKQISENELLQLFYKQFHIQDANDWFFHLLENFVNPLNCGSTADCSIFFSSALLASKTKSFQSLEMEGLLRSENKGDETQTRHHVGLLGSVTSLDARSCLLKAPMLCNLSQWSQWDSVFAPTLGPLLDWMEREGLSVGLVCLITCEGPILRIDGSATVDGFLAAAVKGCGREAAVQFVSILAVYRGVDQVPHTLLKSHLSKAIEILVGKSQTLGRLKRKPSSVFVKDQVIKRAKQHAFEDTGSLSRFSSEPLLNGGEHQSFAKYWDAIDFVFDFISCVPSELVVFAGSIIIPSLSQIVPAAPGAMLDFCVTTEHRMKLHEIGMALGIPEWMKDFSSLFLASTMPDKSSAESLLRVTVHDQNESSIPPACRLNDSGEDKTLVAKEVTNKHMLETEALSPPNTAHVAGEQHGGVGLHENIGTSDGVVEELDQSNNEMEARDVIEKIRKEEFGIDLDLESKELCLLTKQHARMGRALQCLSRELYSQDSHFVLELVQNADDNQYEPGVDAMLVFILQSKRIVVVNNEMGFSPANVKALCDVGSSTKSGSAAGYIGHKGIGFKSVFRVTDAPEIHSRGFHIKFDVSHGNIGFILPTMIRGVADWQAVNEVLATTEKLTGHEKQVWNTCMVLPLKPSVCKGTELEIFSSKLCDLQPSLLLFLHRLQSITVKDDLTGSIRVMQRQELNDGLVRVVDGGNCATWLVVKQKFDAIVERPGVCTTEIALAFPLRELSIGVYEALTEHQQVFSFLPLRSYGLRFIVQGDFVLPASREEIDSDSAWNQWLLSEIPKVFVKAVEAVKELACFRLNPGRAISLLMSFIPLEGELQGIFSSLPRMILGSLRASHCLPVEDKEGEWALPCVLLGGWTAFSRRLLPADLVREHLGLHYLHRDVTINSVLASSLGVHMYGLRVLIGIMESLCSRKEALETLGPRWISTWLVALHRCFIIESQQAPFLIQSRTDIEDLKKLRQLPFIPLSNGTYTALEEGPVWLPFVDAGTVNETDAFLQDFPLLYSELRTINSLLLNPIYVENSNSDLFSTDIESSSLKTEYRSLVSLMLNRLGVGQVLPHEILTTQIMPSMLSEDFLKKEKALVLQYVAFVMVHLQSNCKQCKTDRSKLFVQLQKNAVIATNNGYRKPENQPLHFGLEFGCSVDVNRILNGLQIDWTEIDPAYLQAFNGWPEETALSEWRHFFRELGASDFVKVENAVKRVRDKSASIWKGLSWEGCDDRDDLCVQDWECPELVQILRGLCDSDLDLPQKLAQCSHLLSAFDLLWEEHYSDCKGIYWCERAAKKLENHTEASFILQMRSFAWVQSSFDGRLYHPTKLFHRCFAVELILGNNAPYANPQIQCAKLVEALGLRTKVSVLDVLDLLGMWNRHPFEASLGQMTRLYTFLWNEMAQHKEDVLVFFQTHASVFVPLKMTVEPDTPVWGLFLPLKDICWSDETGSLALMMRSEFRSKDAPSQGLCLRALDSFYPTIHGFFVDVGLLRDTLNFKELFSVLKILAEIYKPHEILEQVLAVFAKWSRAIEMGHMSPADCCELKDLLQNVDSCVLPTVQDEWVSLHSSTGLVCWCDDEMLGQQFMQSRGIFFVHVHVQNSSSQKLAEAVGNFKNSSLSSFLQAMDIHPLSEVVEREPIVYGVQNSRQLSDLLNWSLPYVQRYLWKRHPDSYTMLQQSLFSSRLNQFQCFLAGQIFYRYSLPGGLGCGNERFECDYLLQGDFFYATQIGNFNSLFLEYSRLFFNGTSNMQLANFLHLITLSAQSGSQETELETQLLNSQGISPLPEKEKWWTIESRNIKMLLDSASERQVAWLPDDPDAMPKKRARGAADNVWPPRSWHQTQTNSLYRPHLDRIEACEKSLASVMKNIEAKKKFQYHTGESHGSSETHACESGGPHGVGRSVSPNEKDQRFEKAIVFVPDMGTTSQDDNVETVNKKKGEELAPISSRDPFLVESSLLRLNDASDGDFEPDGTPYGSFADREQLSVGQPNEQQQTLTGRLGEAVVFNHLLEKHGPAHVTWINAEAESGLPYDIIVNEFDGREKLIEVKAT